MRANAGMPSRRGMRGTPAARSVAGTRTDRRAAPLLVAAVLLAAAGCASDAPVRPESPRSDVVPSGVSDMRESLASQRGETLDRMDTVRPEAADAPTGGPGMLDTVMDAVGWATGTAVDVLTLQAFGIW